jgi:hypothetical protein
VKLQFKTTTAISTGLQVLSIGSPVTTHPHPGPAAKPTLVLWTGYLKDIAQPHPHKLPAIVPSEVISNNFASMQCLRIYSTNHFPDEKLKLQATSPRLLHPKSRNKSAQARSTPPQSTHNLKSTSRLHKGPLQKRVEYHHHNRPRHPHHLPLPPSILSARTHKPHKQG